MSLDSKPDLKAFGKGTLPGWFTVILLAIMAYMAKGFMEDYRESRLLGQSTDKRVTVLELQYKAVNDSITELRFSNKDILTELRAISVQLQKK